MLRTIKTISLLAMLMGISLATPSMASHQAFLDFEGTGHTTTTQLNFPYFIRQANDRFTEITQGGYKVYNLADSLDDVAIVGPFRPCVGVAATDGKKMVLFHVHSTNALDEMKKVIKDNLDLSNSSHFFCTYLHNSGR